MNSIFPVLSLDRRQSQWESHLGVLTPWEDHGGIWLKREDYFAPLGYGGPNGSKMRQLIHFFHRHRGNATHVVTGASLQSPQLSMSAIVAAHYGLPITQVVYSKPETVLNHVSPRVARGFGAEFDYAKGPYNPILQARVAQLAAAWPDTLVVHYGISLPTEDFGAEELRAFHECGARQVENMPAGVERLIMPAGSCNSLCSVLLGLIQDSRGLKELYTLGIGPSKAQWVVARMRKMGLELGDLPFRWRHFSLHDNKYAAYTDKFHGEHIDDVALHPTYEGKMWRWLRTHNPVRLDGKTAFWIVGSDTDERVVEPFYTHPEKTTNHYQSDSKDNWL